MKKNIKKIAFIVGGLVLTACSEDRFNVLPNSQDTPSSVFTSEENYRPVVDAAYDYMKMPYSGDTGNLLVVGDLLADNLIFSPHGRGTNKSAYEWSFTAQTGAVTSFYSELYRVISRANLVIDNVSKVPVTPYMKNIEAEARGIRAIAHFDLVRMFSKIPTQSADANNSLGIAYIKNFDPAIKTTRDAKVSETYQKILEDLNFALGADLSNDGDDNINASNGSGRLDRAAILGYLSKVYLYMGDYDKSIEYGERCIAMKPSVGSMANFPKIWTDSSEDGVLFSILNSNSRQDNVNIGVGYNQNQSGIRSEQYVNYDFFTKFTDSDVRKGAYVLTADFNGTPYNHVVKYRKRDGSSVAGIVNVKLLRTADVYLTLAEAYLKSQSNHNEVRALKLLNDLRKERYSNYVAGTETGADLLDAVLHERRLEMAFENDRFWTLKRLGKPVVRSSYGSSADGSGTDVPQGNLKELPVTSHRFVLPIPNSAIRQNAKLQQNPGY